MEQSRADMQNRLPQLDVKMCMQKQHYEQELPGGLEYEVLLEAVQEHTLLETRVLP